MLIDLYLPQHILTQSVAGSMGGTYAGNAVSCAAGVACAQVMKNDQILENVKARYGRSFRSEPLW